MHVYNPLINLLSRSIYLYYVYNKYEKQLTHIYRPTFYRVYKKRSTESFQAVPYVTALLSAMLWLYYALLSMDVLLLSINAIACVVESFYLAVFLSYAPKAAMVYLFIYVIYVCAVCVFFHACTSLASCF